MPWRVHLHRSSIINSICRQQAVPSGAVFCRLCDTVTPRKVTQMQQVWTDTWNVKPGRAEDFLGVMERFDEILTRLDVRPSYHTVVQQFGGPVGGFLTFHHTFGYPSYAAYGVAADTFFDDPEFQELFGVTLLGADGPAESVSASIGQVMFSKTG
jgi:hypothetical protein